MARSRAGASKAPAARSAPPAHKPAAAPAHAAPAPAPAMAAPSSGPGFMGMIAQGMAFGAGSEVAHQAVRSVMGGSSSGHAPQEAAVPQQPLPQQMPVYNAQYTQQAPQGSACTYPQQDLMKCLQEQNGNAGACQFYFDALKQCQETAQQRF